MSRLTPGGGKRTVADAYGSKRLNSPNDCAVHSSGAIYFTDPPYGLPRGWDDDRRELDFCGVYRVAPDGTHLGTMLTGQATANCGFGDDGTTLSITADAYLCRVRLLTRGPLPGP